MGVEIIQEFGQGMIGCAQLEKEDVLTTDNSITAEFGIIVNDVPPLDQLVVGMEGVCVTGQKGECPRGHNCGKIKITAPIVPLYVEIEPIEVKSG